MSAQSQLTQEQFTALRRFYTSGGFGAVLTQTMADQLLALGLVQGAGAANAYRLTHAGAAVVRGR